MVRPILLASFAAILPMSVQAQGRAMMPTASHAVAAVPRVVAHVAQPMVRPAVPAGRIVARTGTPRTRVTAPPTPRNGGRPVAMPREGITEGNTTDFVPVPGLGFDMTHLAATRGPEAVGAGRHGN